MNQWVYYLLFVFKFKIMYSYKNNWFKYCMRNLIIVSSVNVLSLLMYYFHFLTYLHNCEQCELIKTIFLIDTNKSKTIES